MKLREVIRAINGFQYQVWEYDVFPTGKFTRRELRLKVDETNIRCKQHDMRHEKLVKGKWFIVSPDEFLSDLHHIKNNQIVVRSKNTERKVVREKIQLSLIDSIMVTDHAENRMWERFGIDGYDTKKFIEETLKNHFIVQNYQFYNGRYSENGPDAIAVCSQDLRTILVVKPQNRRYILLTCYNPLDPNYNSFYNWFTDHKDQISEMPRLEDYFGSV